VNTRAEIDIFLNDKNLAIAGVSRNSKKFGNYVFRILQSKGFAVYPINPNADTIEGVPCYSRIQDLPIGINNLLIITHKSDTLQVLNDAMAKGIRNIWIQQSCDTPETIKLAKNNTDNLITRKCILMYACPDGFHNFHRWLAGIIGSYVK
jgi:predicted CoA-binding protein